MQTNQRDQRLDALERVLVLLIFEYIGTVHGRDATQRIAHTMWYQRANVSPATTTPSNTSCGFTCAWAVYLARP